MRIIDPELLSGRYTTNGSISFYGSFRVLRCDIKAERPDDGLGCWSPRLQKLDCKDQLKVFLERNGISVYTVFGFELERIPREEIFPFNFACPISSFNLPIEVPDEFKDKELTIVSFGDGIYKAFTPEGQEIPCQVIY